MTASLPQPCLTYSSVALAPIRIRPFLAYRAHVFWLIACCLRFLGWAYKPFNLFIHLFLLVEGRAICTHREVRRGSNANLDGDRFLHVSSSRTGAHSLLLANYRLFLDPCFLDFRSMIESVNRSSSKGPLKGWGSTICGALRVPGLSPLLNLLPTFELMEHNIHIPRIAFFACEKAPLLLGWHRLLTFSEGRMMLTAYKSSPPGSCEGSFSASFKRKPTLRRPVLLLLRKARAGKSDILLSSKRRSFCPFLSFL